jgi:hypothetical protein
MIAAGRKKMILCCAVMLAAVSLTAQDAEEIVRSSRDRIQAEAVYTRSTMILMAKTAPKPGGSLNSFPRMVRGGTGLLLFSMSRDPWRGPGF